MNKAVDFFRVCKPFFYYLIIGLLALMLSRTLLLLWQIERVESISVFFTVLLNGVRIDLSTLGYLALIPALLHPIFTLTTYQAIWLKILKYWFYITLVFVLYFEFATPMFIDEYDLRPNRLFIEYLIYPKEVFKMLFNGHLLPIIITFTLLGLTAYGLWRFVFKCVFSQLTPVKVSTPLSVSAGLFLVIMLFLSARGTIGHRPINPALVYFSSDPLINSLTLNSAYSVAFAFKQLGNEKDATKLYGKLSDERVIALVREATGLSEASFTHPDIPSLAKRIPSYRGKPKNLVIILQESLGAQFTGHLGGMGITPNLDKMMVENWSFNQLYATGTRSVRGIEAVVTGFTPTPARAVVKLDKSQQGFFTLASLLQRHHYETQFIYGGESHFDNMKSFFLGNGFSDIVDFKDIENPAFVASWGASDEDLFNQADKELLKLHQADKPFFSLIFTSSNHDPFEIPDGKIDDMYPDMANQPQDKESRRQRAISYADYAVGKFIDKAKNSAYWQNTIFLIVADHDARTFGTELVPIKSFHIPAIILGKDIAPKQDNRLASQIDLAPTLISLMGIEDETPMLGHDLTQENIKERAMMQFAENFAYLTKEQVAVLQPQKPVSFYTYDFVGKKLESSESTEVSAENIVLGDIALAHSLFGSLAYHNGWYRLADEQK